MAAVIAGDIVPSFWEKSNRGVAGSTLRKLLQRRELRWDASILCSYCVTPWLECQLSVRSAPTSEAVVGSSSMTRTGRHLRSSAVGYKSFPGLSRRRPTARVLCAIACNQGATSAAKHQRSPEGGESSGSTEWTDGRGRVRGARQAVRLLAVGDLIRWGREHAARSETGGAGRSHAGCACSGRNARIPSSL
jgi:hypothetical protein